MINIHINKMEATQEEIKYLESLEGFQVSISELMNNGKTNGVSVTIEEINDDGSVLIMKNTSTGISNLVIGTSRKGKSFITDGILNYIGK